MKALEIMQSVYSATERAQDFANSFKRDLQKEILDVLIVEIEKLEDKIKETLDFTLRTDLNAGIAPITRPEAKERFTKACELEYKLTLLKLELAAKQKIFDKYFGEDGV